MKPRILYVEDDESLSFVTKDHLEQEGYDVIFYKTGNEAMAGIAKGGFDLCILDIMLPGVDGYSLAKRIRKNDAEIPIIFLSAKSLKEDRIHGLKIGADDYLTKPFDIEELILKIEVFLKRRKIITDSGKSVYKLSKFVFDYKNFMLISQDSEKKLTKREADLLKYLCDNKDEVVQRADILKKLWGEDDYFNGRSMDVFVSRLRKYLKSDTDVKIENIHGVGFKLSY